ncbi:MAG TPA: YbaK/EbsC family protein [Aggregatilineaceae bacterium]|nr:YbaK/EbsC family protein [Aggregatilineaceae bacterium]
MEPWTPADLQRYIDAHAIPAQIVALPTPTLTVPTAAEALGVPVDTIVKTVIFFVEETPYAVIANGVRRVDPRKLAAQFGVNRKRIKLADGEAVLALTGYPPGAVPPFGHRQPMPYLMHPGVCDQSVVYAGGGGKAELLRIQSADLRRLTGATLVDVLSEDIPAQDADTVRKSP